VELSADVQLGEIGKFVQYKKLNFTRRIEALARNRERLHRGLSVNPYMGPLQKTPSIVAARRQTAAFPDEIKDAALCREAATPG